MGIREQENNLLRRTVGWSICFNAIKHALEEGLIGLREFKITLTYEVNLVWFVKFSSPTLVRYKWIDESVCILDELWAEGGYHFCMGSHRAEWNSFAPWQCLEMTTQSDASLQNMQLPGEQVVPQTNSWEPLNLAFSSGSSTGHFDTDGLSGTPVFLGRHC